jgi:hypothetical protein
MRLVGTPKRILLPGSNLERLIISRRTGPIFLIFTLEEMVLTLSTATIGLILYALLFSEMYKYIIAAAMSGFLFMFYVEIIYRVHIKRIVRR